MADWEGSAARPRITRRPVRWPDDAPFLERLYASTRAEELAPTGWPDGQKEGFCRQQFEAQHAHYRAHYPDAAFEVIERDGVPAGRLYVDRWANEIRVVDLAMLPEHRGRGVGTRLLAALAAEAEAAGKLLTVHVERFNPALRLYERMGFRLAEDKGVYLFLSLCPDGPA